MAGNPVQQQVTPGRGCSVKTNGPQRELGHFRAFDVIEHHALHTAVYHRLRHPQAIRLVRAALQIGLHDGHAVRLPL